MVIVGCGRVGSGLAQRLLNSTTRWLSSTATEGRSAGSTVSPAERIEGIGYDRATLRRAGVERATAVAAVTNGDNSNIVAARTAREAFGVRRVFARIYDVRRAAVYERLGIPTVASARLTIDMSMRQLMPTLEAVRWVDPGAEVCLVERPASPSVDRRQRAGSRGRRPDSRRGGPSARCQHPADGRPGRPGWRSVVPDGAQRPCRRLAGRVGRLG